MYIGVCVRGGERQEREGHGKQRECGGSQESVPLIEPAASRILAFTTENPTIPMNVFICVCVCMSVCARGHVLVCASSCVREHIYCL
jgi:hypothetical protein